MPSFGSKPATGPSAVAREEPVPEALPAALIRAGRGAASSVFIHRARGNSPRRGDWSATAARAIRGKKRKHLLPFLQRLGLFRR